MGIDTTIILIPCIIAEILMKTRFPVMAALICILRGLPKNTREASFRILKSTREPKKFVPPQCTLIGPCHRTISHVLYGDWFSVVATCNSVDRINKIKLRGAPVIPGLVTTFGGYTIYFPSHTGPLSLAIPP